MNGSLKTTHSSWSMMAVHNTSLYKLGRLLHRSNGYIRQLR